MNSSQKRVISRLILMGVFLTTGFLTLFLYLSQNVVRGQNLLLIGVATILYFGMLTLLWYRERSLYYDYIMKKRIASGQIQYMLCPLCKTIQLKGSRKCTSCGEKWLSCKSCMIPFEAGDSVLVAPCCGEGFHVEHFEVALRQFSHCPYCKSDLAIKTTNW